MTAIPIGDGLTRFAVQTADGEKTIALDLVEATQQYNYFVKKCKDAGQDNFEYLDDFSAWVELATGTKLIKAQSFQLIQEINKVFAGKVDRPADALGQN